MATATEQLALPSGERRSDPSITVYGILVLGVAVLMAMGALVGVYLALRSGTAEWPPKGVTLQQYFDNTLCITALIGVVGGWWALYGVRNGERRQAIMGLALAIFMQGAFINLLTYDTTYTHLSPRQDAYGVIWYALMVTVIGVAGVTLARVARGQVTPREPALAWAAAWYGTVVAAVWFVMYYVIHV